VFTARYALSPYIKQIRFVFKGLICTCAVPAVSFICLSVRLHNWTRTGGLSWKSMLWTRTKFCLKPHKSSRHFTARAACFVVLSRRCQGTDRCYSVLCDTWRTLTFPVFPSKLFTVLISRDTYKAKAPEAVRYAVIYSFPNWRIIRRALYVIRQHNPAAGCGK
jgi:hypothetical protein